MKHIKTIFSIKDLENLSGIKAHTIRIWEKRYGLLEPERTDTNIRFYSLQSLQKLLNISFLNTNGYKISKIAELDEMGFKTEIDKLVNSQVNKDDFLNNLKISM
ncbi:MAG: MerR family transcriptional regulator, partial [Mangrovimonas sp.]|nr:MerR family transcriptional regulator [Mangrovimonas sp.]